MTRRALIAKVEQKNVELQDQYLTEGQFVYELYAIMIH